MRPRGRNADRLAGDVVALNGNTLSLRLNTARALAVTLPADARISGRAPAKLADIVPTRTSARRRPHKLTERCWYQVHLSRVDARAGQGRYPMPSTPGSMILMFGGRVDAAARGSSTMTNARLPR